jgi:hypothetical protein
MTLRTGQYIVSGVTSNVKECNTLGNMNKPNMYTRIVAYKTWIKSVIEQSNNLIL